MSLRSIEACAQSWTRGSFSRLGFSKDTIFSFLLMDFLSPPPTNDSILSLLPRAVLFFWPGFLVADRLTGAMQTGRMLAGAFALHRSPCTDFNVANFFPLFRSLSLRLSSFPHLG